jgi:hypothetical protein
MEALRPQTEQFQDEFILFIEKVSESVYDKFVSGELTNMEFEDNYLMLRDWIQKSEALLKILEWSNKVV